MPDAPNRDQRGSPDRFGYEWGLYAELLPHYEQQFRRWTPFLEPGDWKGLRFLDVGCGMGRNSLWPMRYGAAGGVAADIDERSLESARRTLAEFPAVEVRRCSAYELPQDGAFDIAFSIGVIHHLEDPPLALRRMAGAVKPGGRVMIWVYGRENNEYLVRVLDPLRKALFSRLPVAVTHHLSLYPALLLWAALRLGLRPNAYFRQIAAFRFRHLRSIVFDQMLPRIAHYWSREDVDALMKQAGLSDVELSWVNEMSWAAIGRRTNGR